MRRRRASILAGLGTLSALVILAAAPPAGAHAYLASSNPADGASLTIAPAQLRLGFSESIVPGATSLDLRDSRGTRYPISGVRIESSSPDGDTEEPVTLFATLPKLPQSAYRLSWATLSSDDLHRTSGVIVFGIGEAVTAAGTREPWPAQDELMLRWLMFCGIALAFGGLLAVRLLARLGGQHRTGYRLAGASALSAAVAAAVLLIVQGHSVGVGTVLRGHYGDGWLTRETGLLVFASACLVSSGRPGIGRRSLSVLYPAAIAAIAIGSALVGHSALRGPSYVLADALHLASTAAWVGCPIVLLLCSRRTSAPQARPALTAFARPAAALVGLTVVSGIYLASSVVVSVDAAIATRYGRVLLVKICLFAIVALLGLVNFSSLRRRPAARIRRTVGAEAVVAVLVLGLAATLTSSEPAREPGFLRTSPVSSTSADHTAADLEETLSVRPNRPGQNLVVLGIFDRRRPAPGQISQVVVQVFNARGQIVAPVVAEALPDHTWSASVELPGAGPVSVRVSVDRAGLTAVDSDFIWAIQPPASAARPRLVSQAPIRSSLQLTAILLLATLLLLAAAATIRSARRRDSGAAAPADAAEPQRTLEVIGSG